MVESRVSNTLKFYSCQQRLRKAAEYQIREQERINTTLVNIFSHIIASRNNEPGGHLLRVRKVTDILLRRLIQLNDAYLLRE